MNITKLGHCCLVLKINGLTILTDPGNFTTAQDTMKDIDVVLITHEHQDHYHADSVKAVLKNNPQAVVVANSAMTALLKKDTPNATVMTVGDSQSTEIKEVKIEGFGTKHAEIYGEMGQVENTGYFVAEKFYFPGDNFYSPGKAVDVLALPVAAPWMHIKECINFAKEIKARTAFGVHDGMIVPSFRPFIGMLLNNFAPQTKYVALADGESKEF